MNNLANFAKFEAGIYKQIVGNGDFENMAKEAAITMAKSAGKFATDNWADFVKKVKLKGDIYNFQQHQMEYQHWLQEWQLEVELAILTQLIYYKLETVGG